MNENPRCPDCGHPDFFHRATGESTTIHADDPVPCYAAVSAVLQPDETNANLRYRYRFCGCTTVRALTLELFDAD
jgi:hypothetical protein